MQSQIPLDLQINIPAAREFFVLHSGLTEAYCKIESDLAALARGDRTFHYYELIAPPGAGTSSFLEYIQEAADSSRCIIFDAPIEWKDEEIIARFVSSYEELKASGGLLIVANPGLTSNPHIISRLRGALPLEIRYPLYEELRPLLVSILEKRGLKFDEAKLSYLLDRLPASPLSLSAILAKIDALSLMEGKGATRRVFREALTSFRDEIKDGREG